MKKPGLILLAAAIIAGGLNYSCQQAGNQENRLPAWSSNDPLAIPYWIRQQKADKGNLVRNGSFETGKWLSVDTLTKSYSIDGWQKKGTHVYWVDLTADSTIPADEIYTGQHAIKIMRTTADEIVNEGEGIISNFIRVIPGNYSFSFYARMLDIRPYSARLGTRMYDAVEIRLLFFDKNKIAVNSRTLMPFKGQQIDNSFKSLSLANFDHIKEFDWGRIIGKSHSFPFQEGDIPDNARYVKLFIGLKGTGTLWVDDVDFYYTKSNFTSLERFSKLMDSTLTKQDLIIPAPKQIDKMASVVLYRQGQDKESLPRIVIPAQYDEDTRKAFSLLQEKLISVLEMAGADKGFIKSLVPQSDISQDEISQAGIVFSVGKNSMYLKYREMLPVKAILDHDQGYFVYTSNDLPNVVFIAGNKGIGDFYAAASVIQLFDNRFPVFYNARIIDYPDVLQRFYYIDAWKDQQELNSQLNTIRDLLPFKVNGAYIGVALDTDRSFYFNTLSFFGNQWRHSDAFQFIQWIIPSSADRLTEKNTLVTDTTYLITGNNKTEELILRLMDAGQQAKALGMAVAPSFICPCDSTLCYNLSDVLKLADNFRNETQFMLRLQEYMVSRYPSGILEYCLPWYNNELIDYSLGYADALLATMMDDLHERVSFLWSGSSFYTVKTDAADIVRYNGLLKKQTVLMDNSLMAYSKKAGYGGSSPYYLRKLRLYNFFEPFGNAELLYYSNLLNHNRIFIHQPVHSELEKIKVLTANDFYWNMENYDQDFSLWKILVSRYGIETAKELMLVGDAMVGLLEINLRLQQKDQLNKNYRTGGEMLVILREHLDHVAESLGKDHPLVTELDSIYQENKNSMESLIQANQP